MAEVEDIMKQNAKNGYPLKEMLLAARQRYENDLKGRARRITPHLLSECLKYVRNLTLIELRMSPDLYTLVTAAKQVAGDQYALRLAETARLYPYTERDIYGRIAMGIDKAHLAGESLGGWTAAI